MTRSHSSALTLTTARLWAALIAGLAVLVLLISGCSAPGNNAGADAAATGEVTSVTVGVTGMLYDTSVIEVPYGNRLEVTLDNTGMEMHDLRFDNGARTKRLAPGRSEVIDVGVITGDMDGWCTIAGHRAQGMELVVVVTGAPEGAATARG